MYKLALYKQDISRQQNRPSTGEPLLPISFAALEQLDDFRFNSNKI